MTFEQILEISRVRRIAREEPLGAQLREARIKAHLTQGDVAEVLDTAATTVSSWENGRMKPPARFVKPIQELIERLKGSSES